MTRVKICGITRVGDALAAAAAGADALGFVFYRPSPRYIEPAQAAAIIRKLPPFVTTTALFVDAAADEVAAIVAETGVDLLQFHGDEAPEYCVGFDRPWIKALRMRPDVELDLEVARFAQARGLLLDAYRPGVPGGTGEAFDWARIPPALASRIVLAGGLTPDNVAQAVSQVRPWAVDVSGGVEQAKGVKQAALVQRFIREVRQADEGGRASVPAQN